MRKTKEQRAIGARLERLYAQHCHGLQVPIMSLGTIWRAGEAAAGQGLSDDEVGAVLRASALLVAVVRP